MNAQSSTSIDSLPYDTQPTVLYQKIRTLENQDRQNVSPQDLITIDSALLLPDIPYRHRFFLLAGFLNREAALRAVPLEYRRTTRDMNAYDLAMIRIGDASRVRRLEQLLREAVVNDDFIYDIAPRLIYTRRPEVIDFFFQAILSDERNCFPADAHTNGQINCAYRLLEMIAPIIRDFPLQVGPSGDLEVEDYPRALDLVRMWIRENIDTYQIITETY
ncbi:MAG: hypothetical protein AAGF87_04075 [Bacteroidota bacterium]